MNRTYVLDDALIERVDATARRLAVGQSELVNYLLDQALTQVDAGRLAIPVAPRVYGIMASHAASTA